MSIRRSRALAALGIVLTACGPGIATGTPTQVPSPGTLGAATPAPGASGPIVLTPSDGGTLVVGLDGDIALTDPALVSDADSIYVAAQVVQGLVGLQPGTIDKIIPVLASDLPTVSADAKTYTFKLRSGIKFHDGSDFNADAVVYDYERWQDLPAGDLQAAASDYRAVFGGFRTASNIASVTAPDESTVVFTLRQPQSNFLLSQTLQVFGIESEVALKRDNADATPLAGNRYANGQGESMVGTGPFLYKEWVPHDHITLIRNPNYWDTPNRAHLDRIIFKPIADSTARLQALQAGSIDMAETISARDIGTAHGSGLTIIDRGPSCSTGYLGMNQSVGGQSTIYADRNVRLAIASALDKPRYLTSFYGPDDQLPRGWMPPATQGFKAETIPAYDAQTARDTLAKADLSGSQLAIDLYYPSNVVRPYLPDPKSLAQAIAGDLQAVGFTVTLKTDDWTTAYVHDAQNGVYPLFLFGSTCDWAGADDFIFTGVFGYQGGKPDPQFGLKDDALNQAMLNALRSTTADQADQSYGQAQDLIAADMPSVPLVDATAPGASTSKVHGLVGAGNLTEYLDTVWFQ